MPPHPVAPGSRFSVLGPSPNTSALRTPSICTLIFSSDITLREPDIHISQAKKVFYMCFLPCSYNALNFTVRKLFKHLKADSCSSKLWQPGVPNRGNVPCPAPRAPSVLAPGAPCEAEHVSSTGRHSGLRLGSWAPDFEVRFHSLTKSLLKATLVTKITFHEIL